MGFCMGFYSALMGFYSDLMGYEWDTLWLFNIAMETG